VKSLKHSKQNGDLVNGNHAEGEDVDMEDAEESASGEATSGEDSDSDDDPNITADTIPSILRIAISPDGQWLATSDDQRHTHIFNLDSISVRRQSLIKCLFSDIRCRLASLSPSHIPSSCRMFCLCTRKSQRSFSCLSR
jgi:hypothetical protein